MPGVRGGLGVLSTEWWCVWRAVGSVWAVVSPPSFFHQSCFISPASLVFIIMRGTTGPPSNTRYHLPVFSAGHRPPALSLHRVRHPPLIETLLRNLPSATIEVQLQALAHLRALCEHHRGNCDALLAQPGWQQLLLELLLPPPPPSPKGAPQQLGAAALPPNPGPADVEGEMHAEMQELLRVVHAHALLNSPQGWLTLQLSLACVSLVVGRQTPADVLLPLQINQRS